MRIAHYNSATRATNVVHNSCYLQQHFWMTAFFAKIKKPVPVLPLGTIKVLVRIGRSPQQT